MPPAGQEGQETSCPLLLTHKSDFPVRASVDEREGTLMSAQGPADDKRASDEFAGAKGLFLFFAMPDRGKPNAVFAIFETPSIFFNKAKSAIVLLQFVSLSVAPIRFCFIFDCVKGFQHAIGNPIPITI